MEQFKIILEVLGAIAGLDWIYQRILHIWQEHVGAMLEPISKKIDQMREEIKDNLGQHGQTLEEHEARLTQLEELPIEKKLNRPVQNAVSRAKRQSRVRKNNSSTSTVAPQESRQE